MSAQHHSPSEIAAQRRMLEEFLHKEKPRFPQGQIAPNDRGEIAFAIAVDQSKRAVVIRFAKPVDWIGLGRSETLELANMLIEKAAQLPHPEPQTEQRK